MPIHCMSCLVIIDHYYNIFFISVFNNTVFALVLVNVTAVICNTKVFKWVLVNLVLGGNPAMDWHSIHRGE